MEIPRRIAALLSAARRLLWSNRLALSLAAIPFVLHVLAFNRYGFFRDELYFIVCGRHPAFGYVDQPPLAPLLAAASQSWGQSLWLLRVIPALFGSGAVLASCGLARLLGGGRAALVFAGLCAGLSPLLLAMTGLLETTSLEPFFWTLVVYAVLRATLRDQPNWFVIAGIAAGIGLQAKYTIAFLLVGLIVGIMVAGPRCVFRVRQFWFGVAATIVLVVPNLSWQLMNGWPFWEVLTNDAAAKNVILTPDAWMLAQVVMYGPLMAPVWFAGLAALAAWKRTRFVGIGALLIYPAFFVMHARDYYLAGLYPVLFAAGGIVLERLLRIAAVRTVYATVLVATSVLVAPIALPLLDEKTFIAYRSSAEALLAETPAQESPERFAVSALPQHFADMHGWNAIVKGVHDAERTLTPSERAQAVIFTENYGEAAALDVLGDERVPVTSGHNNYFLWGPRGEHAVVIFVGGNIRDYQHDFADVHRAATIDDPYARPDQIGVGIFVARGRRPDAAPFWLGVRHYD